MWFYVYFSDTEASQACFCLLHDDDDDDDDNWTWLVPDGAVCAAIFILGADHSQFSSTWKILDHVENVSSRSVEDRTVIINV